VSCPTKYFPEASSINFRRSVVYGIGCLRVAGRFFSAATSDAQAAVPRGAEKVGQWAPRVPRRGRVLRGPMDVPLFRPFLFPSLPSFGS
jgi:hypothetical protein